MARGSGCKLKGHRALALLEHRHHKPACAGLRHVPAAFESARNVAREDNIAVVGAQLCNWSQVCKLLKGLQVYGKLKQIAEGIWLCKQERSAALSHLRLQGPFERQLRMLLTSFDSS